MEAWWSRATAVRGLIRFSGPGRADRSTSDGSNIVTAEGTEWRPAETSRCHDPEKISFLDPFIFVFSSYHISAEIPQWLKHNIGKPLSALLIYLGCTGRFWFWFWSIDLLLMFKDNSPGESTPVLSCPALSFIYDLDLSDLWILAYVTAMLLLRPWIFRRCCRRNQDDLDAVGSKQRESRTLLEGL